MLIYTTQLNGLSDEQFYAPVQFESRDASINYEWQNNNAQLFILCSEPSTIIDGRATWCIAAIRCVRWSAEDLATPED
jgi:hypothetical protein